MAERPVGRFFVRVLALMPICFGIWYYLGGFFTLLLSFPVEWILTGIWHESVAAIENSGYMMEIITHFQAPVPPGMAVPEGQVPLVTVSLNPLIYGYSLPLFCALVLAAPGDESSRWKQIGIGLAVLLPVQVYGICCDILRTLVFKVGPGIGVHVLEPGWRLDALALAYQLGYLILPAVTPVVVWVLLNGTYLGKLAPGLNESLAGTRN